MAITEKDKRLCKVYINYINNNFRRVDIQFNKSWSAEECCVKINAAIDSRNSRCQDNIISDILSCKDDFLHIEEFHWLNNPRINCLAWCLIYEKGHYIKRVDLLGNIFTEGSESEISESIVNQFKNKTPSDEYVSLIGDYIPNTLEFHRETIINFFDYLNIDLDGKIKFINELKNKSIDIASKSNPIELLKKSKNYDIDETWNFLKNREFILPYIKPITDKEKEVAICAFFDMLNVSGLFKESLIKKIKTRLTKIKHDIKHENLCKLNMMISPESKEKLEKIANDIGISKKAVIEGLIKDRYDVVFRK